MNLRKLNEGKSTKLICTLNIHRFCCTYFIVEASTSHSVFHRILRGHTCTVMRRRKTSGPFERNELSLNARGSIHSASVAQEVHSARTLPVAHVLRYVCIDPRVCTMCLRRIYLHTGSAIGDDTGIERISSLRRCRRRAKSRVARLDVNVTKPALNHAAQI